MGILTKTPSWIKAGPQDLEYKTYKMLGRIGQLKQQLLDGNLMGTLYEVDDTLDYLYKYDAIKVTSADTHVDNLISMGFEWDNLELVFSTEEQIEGSDILDQAGVQNVANLPTIGEARAKIVGILVTPASKLVSIFLARSEKMSNLAPEISEKTT